MICCFLCSFLVNEMAPLECYSCGGPKSLKSSCDDFHHENSDYKETCETHMKSCIKTYGAFKNISGMYV